MIKMAEKKDNKVEEPEEPVESSEEEEEELDETQAPEGEEEDKGFAFAMAPVVRLMKNELDNDKMIRSRVKVEMNLWLEKVCRKVAVKMNESDYTMVELDDFKTAIEPYEMVDDVEQERHRIVASLEKIKQDCDSLIRDVNRKFVSYSGPVVRYGSDEDEDEVEAEVEAEADDEVQNEV